MRFLSRNGFSRCFLKSKLRNSYFFSYFTKSSSSSCWFFAWSATQMRFSSVKKVCQPGLWNGCCFVPVFWSCLLQPGMKRFWQNKNSKLIFSEIREPDPTPAAYIDPWTFFFFQQRSALFLKGLWWLPQGPLTHPLNGVLF